MRGRAWRAFRRNRLALVGAGLVGAFTLIALLSPWIVPHDPTRGDLTRRLQPPAVSARGDWSYPLGTDNLGRDLLSRIMAGSRVSLSLGLLVIVVCTVVGVSLGLISGYVGGWVDTVIQRTVDVLLAFPYLILAIALMALFGPGFLNMVIALAFKEWTTSCRIVRSEVLTMKEAAFVEAARAIGATPTRILFRHLLPNVIPSAIVIGTLRVGWVVLMEASLSFLGLGIQPPQASWGTIIADGRQYLYSARGWWISTFPGIAIFLFVLGMNLFGEGLRDALDPRLTGVPLPE
ncbi:MAG TPA: ABC transporter permease [Candidatus Bipolaricaulis sp.]|nr:ABC transporter permease [Candidatus Bipolaricaulis sp.]HRS14253.1 ABC transporter permease [Candidatus Bipolaricaulis sp.]HRU21674.1 ABC transporter permease [Candidatus Bipolaricaulis sp.]